MNGIMNGHTKKFKKSNNTSKLIKFFQEQYHMMQVIKVNTISKSISNFRNNISRSTQFCFYLVLVFIRDNENKFMLSLFFVFVFYRCRVIGFAVTKK